MTNEKQVLKSFPVYLPVDKMSALNALCKSKRIPKTRIVEAEIDKLLKREGV